MMRVKQTFGSEAQTSQFGPSLLIAPPHGLGRERGIAEIEGRPSVGEGDADDPSATLGSTQESARSHLIGGMVRPGGDVLSLRAYVQLPQHVSDELLHVLMATVVEGDARALSVGQWCGGHDPIRVDDDGLIVRLRELHECHERSILPVGRASRARRPETCDARASRSSLCTENVKARRFKWLAAFVPAPPDAPPRFPVRAALIYAVAE
jgi:hypothetical protein